MLNISKTRSKRDTGTISSAIVYADSNGHVTDDDMRPYNVIVVT